MEVVAELGYHPDPIAARLAKTSETIIALVLPSDSNNLSHTVEKYWQQASRRARFARVSVRIFPYSSQSGDDIVERMEEASIVAHGIVVCAPDSEGLQNKVLELRSEGKKVFSLLTDLEEQVVDRYVGFDNYKLGRTISYFMMLLTERTPGTILFNSHHADTLAYRERMLGHTDFQKSQDWNVEHHAFAGSNDSRSCYHEFLKLVDEDRHVSGIVCWGDRCLDGLVDDNLTKPQHRPKILLVLFEMTPLAVTSLLEGRIDAIFYLDTSLVIRKAIALMLEDLEGNRLMADEQDGTHANYHADFNLYVKENLPDWCREFADAPSNR